MGFVAYASGSDVDTFAAQSNSTLINSLRIVC